MLGLFIRFCVGSIILLCSLSAAVVYSQVRSSANFQIERDSIGAAGGLSTSTNFGLEDTLGEVATGRSTSSSFILDAGFQQQDVVTLTLTGGAAVVMDTALGGISGGESAGSTTVTASTDGPAGYELTIQAATEPALQSGVNTIADYVPVGAEADVVFTTEATDAHFAFSPFGVDVVSRYRTDGLACGLGSASTTACWDGLSTTTKTIASAAGANVPLGDETTIYFKVGIGGLATQPPGTYVATTTITLLSL